MTIHIKYLDNGLGLEITATGIVTGKEFIDAHREIYNERNLVKQKYQIIDKSNCTEYRVTLEDIEKIAQIDINAAKKNPSFIIAIVAPTDFSFGMSRAWQIYAEGSRSRSEIFRDRISANEWIEDQLKV